MEEIHSEQPLGKEEMSMYLDKAGTLIEALPYIQHFQGSSTAAARWSMRT